MMTDRYACPQIDEIWTSEAQMTRWVHVWATVAEVIGHPLPHVSADLLLDRQRGLERRYGHDIAAAAEALRQVVAREDPEAARWVHYGLCSSDVADAGTLLAIEASSDVLVGFVADAAAALEGLARRASEQAVYRTHGRAAQVGSGGVRWRGHRGAIVVASGRATQVVPEEVGFDGPTGTGGELTDEQRDAIVRQLGLFTRTATGQQAADRLTWVHWLRAVADVATACERFATDVRLLAHEGVDEASEGRPDAPEYRGSSSMPHKRNPTRSERICGLAAVVRGLASGYAEAASSCWGSHSLEHSSAERICLPQVTSLVGFILTEVAAIASHLRFDEDAGQTNVRRAPADSYKIRNQLIRDGWDGGDAYEQARDPIPDGMVERLQEAVMVEGRHRAVEDVSADLPDGTLSVDASVTAAVTPDDAVCACGHARDLHRNKVGDCRGSASGGEGSCECTGFVTPERAESEPVEVHLNNEQLPPLEPDVF